MPRISLPASVLAAAALVLPGNLVAQETAGDGADRASRPVLVDIRVGTASPRGALEDLSDAGSLLGAGGGYRFHPRAEARVEISWLRLPRGGNPNLVSATELGTGSRADLIHYTAALLFELTDPVASPWNMAILAGAGGTFLNIREGPVPDFSGHRPTLQVGGQVGYDFTERVSVILRGGLYQILGGGNQAPAYLNSETVLTHEAGVRIRLGALSQ